jgi:hypothetical protein
MATCFLSREELRRRLQQQGHSTWLDVEVQGNTTDILPSPDIIITIALDTDATLRTACRERYYVCAKDECGEPLLYQDARFILPSCFLSASALEPPSGDFMLGPMPWLFVRLVQLSKILLWPNDKYRQLDGSWCFQYWEQDQVQLIQQRFRSAKHNSSSTGAMILDLEEPVDSHIVWQVANYVARSSRDFFVSDLECREVYVLHHHDQVVISIPDSLRRDSLIHELNQQSHVLTDLSGYTSSTDAEYDLDC